MKRFCSFTIYLFYVSVVWAQNTDAVKEKGWQKVGYKTTLGVMDAIKQNVHINDVTPAQIDTGAYYAGHGFAAGASDAIKNKQLQPEIDKAVDHYGILAAQNLVKMRDSLLVMNDSAVSYWLLNWAGNLREKLAGEGLVLDTKKLMAAILNSDTELRSRKIIRGLVDEGLSPVTQKEMTDMINVMGNATSIQAGKITDSIFAHISLRLNEDKSKFDDDVHSYRYSLFVTGALFLLAAGLLAFTVHQKRKYALLNDVLTYEIHKASPEHFNELASKIQDHAKREGVENFLRRILAKRGMLGDYTRNPSAGSNPDKKNLNPDKQ